MRNNNKKVRAERCLVSLQSIFFVFFSLLRVIFHSYCSKQSIRKQWQIQNVANDCTWKNLEEPEFFLGLDIHKNDMGEKLVDQ